jgi:hypothetical protein
MVSSDALVLCLEFQREEVFGGCDACGLQGDGKRLPNFVPAFGCPLLVKIMFSTMDVLFMRCNAFTVFSIF